MSRAIRLFLVFVGCMLLFQLLEFTLASNSCKSHRCQNDGQCIEKNSTVECLCPCNYTGKHCEVKDWCLDAKFSKIGCFTNQFVKEPLFHPGNPQSSSTDLVWNSFLDNITCSCALKAKERRFRFFSLGENGVCAGSNENVFSSLNESLNGCLGKAPNKNECNDGNTLFACVGSAGHDYVYELSEKDRQRCATSDVQDCNDYNYVLRLSDANPSTYVGPIYNAFPAGKPFSVCAWERISKMSGQDAATASYSVPGSDNHYLFGIRIGSSFTLYYSIHNKFHAVFSFSTPNVVDRWFHLCSVANFPQQKVITYIDGNELVVYWRSGWAALNPNGYLIIGRDQDQYWGSFDTGDVFFGDITQFNVWDFVLSPNEVRDLFDGVGTETGNFLAWTNLKKYAHGTPVISGSPVMKWKGKGCKWENWQCDGSGLCQGATFRCPCNDSVLAPRSCTSSAIYETKPCSDHDYILEFPLNLVFNKMIYTTQHISICAWIKVAPGLAQNNKVATIVAKNSLLAMFDFMISSDKKSFKLSYGSTKIWPVTGTLANNEWRHFCLVLWDPHQVQLYHNGNPRGSQYFYREKINGYANLIIGKQFTGSIAHFNIWSVALNAAEASVLAGGAGTQVGNILSWPTIKQITQGTTMARSSSPKMKWTDTNLNCHWSDDACNDNQWCEGATLICPTVHMNDLAPQSCIASSYVPIQKMKRTNWRNDIVDVVLVSRAGNDDPQGIKYSSLFINDIERKTPAQQQGMHFVLLNAKTGKLRESFYCGTNTKSAKKIVNLFLGLVEEVIVLVVVYHSGSGEYPLVVPALKLVLGNSVYIRNTINPLSGMNLIGYHGSKVITWGSFKIAERGTAVTKSTVPLIRESCLDHLYMGAREDGNYVIYPENGPAMTVFCDLATNGGGWTVFQRRHKGDVSFSRNWEQYQHGFGQVDGEFWLGNENLYRLGEGQLLAILTSTSSDSKYALYNQFKVDSSYSLFAKDRSGSISDGIFANSTEGLPFDTYNKSKSAINKCFTKFDGGWWFDKNCGGMNLNAKNEKCKTSFLAYEMMTRVRPQSDDLVMITVPNTVSYEDALEICEQNDKRLCSAHEICGNETSPFGGVVNGEYWIPVIDTFNQWIQVGDTKNYRLCSYASLSFTDGFPSPGEKNVKAETDFKGKICCTVLKKAMVLKKLPTSMTYQDGEEACRNINKRLCSMDEICPYKAKMMGGIISGSHWVPVADMEGKWMFVGNNPHTIGMSAVNPAWIFGDKTFKGNLFCCDIPKANGIVLQTMSNTMSYDQAANNCKNINKRLCSSAQICAADGRTPYGGVMDGDDMWVPVSNIENEWIQIGNKPWQTCITHTLLLGSFPGWGKTTKHVNCRKYLLCCDDPKAPGMMIKTMTRTTSYREAAHGCWEENKRICSQKEICADGITPYGGLISGQHWVPVLDKYNEWLHIGKHAYPPCVTHTYQHRRLPNWGTTNLDRYYRGKVFCCDPIRGARIKRSWKYDLRFHGNESHVSFQRISPLKSFSICWWMLMDFVFEGWKTVFSQWSLSNSKQLLEFALNSRGGYQLTLAGDTRESKFPYDRGVFHHLCITWNSLSGSAKLYRDGPLVETFQNVNIDGQFSDGPLIIGQTMNSSSSFDPERSFRGVITRFNVWDKELHADKINSYSTVCGEEEGNIIAWPEVKLWTSGGVGVEESEACFPANCLDYLYRNKKDDGVYQIKPDNDPSFSVLCDQTTAGGGWAILGKRFNGSVEFTERTWKDYKLGFGSVDGEFWLGNEKIHRMTSVRSEQLLVSGRDQDQKFSVTYQRFQLEEEEKKYAMLFQDAFPSDKNKFEINQQFFTTDNDSDHECSAATYGPYWRTLVKWDFTKCLKSNLFGKWNEGGNKGAQWNGKNKKLKSMQFRIRPSEEFKRPLPVLYQLTNDLTWSSSKDFCHSKNSDLCASSDICAEYPFSGRKVSEKWVPVSDAYGMFTKIGDYSICETKNLGEIGTKPQQQDYKGYVFCCQGFPRRDWRFDIRFKSEGYINIDKMPKMRHFSICWWLRTTPDPLVEWSTIFSFLSKISGSLMQFKHTGIGNLLIRAGKMPDKRLGIYPTITDGNWHHYCLKKGVAGYNMNFFYDGEEQYDMSTPLPQEWRTVIDGGRLVLGRHISLQEDFENQPSMVGELSRFNWWHRDFSSDEISQMSRKCSGEVGNILAWPQLIYWIVGDVEVLEGTTCNKQDAYLWFLDEVNDDDDYEEVFNEKYITKRFPVPTAVTTPDVGALTLAGEVEYVRADDFLDHCITDPSLCEETGFTVAMWLKRKGLVSSILPATDKHYNTLLKWLDDVAGGVSSWLPCYATTGVDLDVALFHVKCDNKGATVTLIKVGDYIFGGFSNENWGGPSSFISSHSSFLFSLYNPDDIGAVKMSVRNQLNHSALYTSDQNGPTFGDLDLKISPHIAAPCCSSVLGETYNLPPGYVPGTDQAKYFLTSKEKFAIDHLEVFYAYVPSEPVGIEDPSVIKDAQMTASSSMVNDTKHAPRYARLNSENIWKTALGDPSPWLQVKLTDVMKIKKIASQACSSDIYTKTFTMSSSMDAITWIPYRENLTQRVFVAVDTQNLTIVVTNTLKNAVETRYVRIDIEDRAGSAHACIRIELYAVVKACPTGSSGSPCPNLLVNDQVHCENADCCFATASAKCLAKQDVSKGIR